MKSMDWMNQEMALGKVCSGNMLIVDKIYIGSKQRA